MGQTDEKQSGSTPVQAPEKFTTEDHSDDVNDPFICLICLELVHKPVVNACGHMFCFLCVHLAMNFGSESYCPVCRRQYMHFPRICEQLHFFLLKALPDAYRRRCKEAYAEEVQAQCISPQFNDGLEFYLNDASGGDTSPTTPDHRKKSAPVGLQSTTTNEDGLPAGSHEALNGNRVDIISSSSNEPRPEQGGQLEVRSVNYEVENGVSSSPEDGYMAGPPRPEGLLSPPTRRKDAAALRIATSGLLCSLCDDLLCRPVVLNCGHVFCEGCVGNRDGAQDLKCSTCGSFHPGPFPSVFLELHHYLDRMFTSEYARRQREMKVKAVEKNLNNVKQNVQPADKQGDEPKFAVQRVHLRVGCDGCGIYPMTGRRFKCKDCGKRPGYDLCLSCHESQTILVGRFNQKHTREHRMEEVGPFHHDRANQLSETEDLGEDMEDIDDSAVIGELTIIGRIPTLNSPSSPF